MEIVSRPAPGHEDYNRFIEAQTVEAESTGYGGGTPEAKGAPPAPGPAPGAAAEATTDGPDPTRLLTDGERPKQED